MKIRKLLSAALLVNLVFSLAMAQGGLTTKTITLNQAAFDNSLAGALGPKVMGYQYVLIKDGHVVTEKAEGVARTAADGGLLKMTVNTPINLGSLQKFVTGTAMIGLMENPAVYSPDRNQSLQMRLDRKITTLFPHVWLKSMKSGIEQVSIRQLLQHRSGFNGYDSKDPRYKKDNRNTLGFLRDSDGFLPDRYDVRDYANINFVLTGYLLPLYQRPDVAKLLGNDIGESQLNDVMADTYIKHQLGKQMDDMLNKRIFTKMKPAINPSCDAIGELKGNVAWGYETKSSTKGIISSSIEKQGNCSGEGGYYMSARDFSNYVAHFSTTDLIMSQVGRDAMFKEGMNKNDRLVWTAATSEPWIGTNFKMPLIVWSNGIPANGKTVLIRLPQNYYLTIFTNSDELAAGDLYAAGIAAFTTGMQHNFK